MFFLFQWSMVSSFPFASQAQYLSINSSLPSFSTQHGPVLLSFKRANTHTPTPSHTVGGLQISDVGLILQEVFYLTSLSLACLKGPFILLSKMQAEGKIRKKPMATYCHTAAVVCRHRRHHLALVQRPSNGYLLRIIPQLPVVGRRREGTYTTFWDSPVLNRFHVAKRGIYGFLPFSSLKPESTILRLKKGKKVHEWRMEKRAFRGIFF